MTVSFATTIKKSQGQSLKHVGVYLPTPVFFHGQLYVVFSRVTSREGLKILITDEDGKDTNVTSNVVHDISQSAMKQHANLLKISYSLTELLIGLPNFLL